jgi:hypothetical protein
MKRKLFILVIIYLLPFILVWVGFVMTAFSFNPREVFTQGSFWGPSVIYWFLSVCVSPVIVEAINETA